MIDNLFLKYMAVIFLSSCLTSQEWEDSFSAGFSDVNGLFIGGSEVLHLVNHKNKMFASVGYWEDENNIWYGGTDYSIGWSQIIMLESEDDDWKVDFDLGANYLRPEILKEVVFTVDFNGNILESPDTLLIVGAYSPNYILGNVTANIFIRNDNTDSWDQVLVYQGDFSSGESCSIRDIELYTDQETGVELLIIPVGTKGVFSGKYNSDLDVKIEIGPNPEIGPLGIRPLGITTFNNDLYFSSGNKIFKRNDGSSPSYDVVHDFIDLNTTVNSSVGGIRGLSTITDSLGEDESMLLMWCPNSQSRGTIYRLEPNGGQGFNRIYETKVSLLVEDFLPGETVTYLLGAYNEFYPFTDPETNNEFHLIGIESLVQTNSYPTWNNFYRGGIFVLRDKNAQYYLQEINGGIDVDDNPLVSVRCYIKSPFEGENSIYFGGFDPNGFTSTNNAWIYKMEWSELKLYDKKSSLLSEYKIYNNYPNPFNPTTTLHYTLPLDGMVEIAVYDLKGRMVKKLLSGHQNAGYKSIKWDATNSQGSIVSAGVYLYTIHAENFSQSNKMVLVQ